MIEVYASLLSTRGNEGVNRKVMRELIGGSMELIGGTSELIGRERGS
ncbi:MAG: hypothetical protein WCK01_04925 [Candidatus Uhrbacteria bacterium]